MWVTKNEWMNEQLEWVEMKQHSGVYSEKKNMTEEPWTSALLSRPSQEILMLPYSCYGISLENQLSRCTASTFLLSPFPSIHNQTELVGRNA